MRYNAAMKQNRRTPPLAPALLLILVAAVMLGACNRGAGDPPAACAASAHEEIAVTDAWIRPASGRPVTAAYLVLCNAGARADALTAVSGDFADSFEIHQSSTDPNGVVSMSKVESIALPPNEIVKLEPGGAHIMVIGLHGAIEPGEKRALTLQFQNASPIEITAEARP